MQGDGSKDNVEPVGGSGNMEGDGGKATEGDGSKGNVEGDGGKGYMEGNGSQKIVEAE